MNNFSFWGNFKKALTTDYFNFNSCSTRKEFWYFTLAYFLILLPYYLIIIGYCALNNTPANQYLTFLLQPKSGILGLLDVIAELYAVYSFIPTTAMTTRRLHDRAWSGCLQLLVFIPVLGWLFFLIQLCLPSKIDNNHYRKIDIQAQNNEDFLTNVKRAFTKDYFNFNGCTTRRAFWSFQLSYYLILYLLMVIFYIVNMFYPNDNPKIFNIIIMIIFSLFFIYCIIPQISITVRRLHDIGWNGWWEFLRIISFFGFIFTSWLFSTNNYIEEDIISKICLIFLLIFLVAFVFFSILRLVLIFLSSKFYNNSYRIKMRTNPTIAMRINPTIE